MVRFFGNCQTVESAQSVYVCSSGSIQFKERASISPAPESKLSKAPKPRDKTVVGKGRSREKLRAGCVSDEGKWRSPMK